MSTAPFSVLSSGVQISQDYAELMTTDSELVYLVEYFIPQDAQQQDTTKVCQKFFFI